MNHPQTTAYGHEGWKASDVAGSAARARHANRRRPRRVGNLLLGTLMIGIPALSALPADAREKGQQVQQRQSERSGSRASSPPARKSSPPPTKSSSPARKSSPPPRRSSPPARKSSPAPRRSSDAPTRSANRPRRESPARESGSRSSRTAERHVYRDSHPGATSSRGTRPSGGTSNRDAWRVGTWPTPVREPDSGDRYRNRRTYEDDRRWNGTYDEHRRKERRKENRYHHRRDRHRYYYGSYRHHYYCGHYWGGYYGWCSYRWYWPWWPTVYVESNRYNDDVWGALDLDVRPEKAEIYLDGQYIGIADEYDGFPSYLWLEKGTYDLAIYAEGYETLFRQVSIYPGIVIDIEDRMRTGPSTHPDDYGPTSTERRDARIARNREKEEAARAQEATAGEAWSSSSPTVAADADVGRLYVSVLPADAAIYLDGHFLGTAAEIGQLSAGIVVEPGDHVIELVRPGYETHRKEIVVPPGERTTVELELDRN